MRHLSLHPTLFAVLTFGLGLGIGLTVEQIENDYLRWRWELAYDRDPVHNAESRCDALRRADSIAANREGEGMQPFTMPPVEIARNQVGEHCAITYAFDASSMTAMRWSYGQASPLTRPPITLRR